MGKPNLYIINLCVFIVIIDMPDWPEADFSELLRRIEDQLPAKDNLKFDSRAAKLDWNVVQFNDYSASECFDVWSRISKRIRRFRTLNEMLTDAKDWVSKPWTNFYRGTKKVCCMKGVTLVKSVPT